MYCLFHSVGGYADVSLHARTLIAYRDWVLPIHICTNGWKGRQASMLLLVLLLLVPLYKKIV